MKQAIIATLIVLTLASCGNSSDTNSRTGSNAAGVNSTSANGAATHDTIDTPGKGAGSGTSANQGPAASGGKDSSHLKQAKRGTVTGTKDSTK